MGIHLGIKYIKGIYSKNNAALPQFVNLKDVKSDSSNVYLDMNALFYMNLMLIGLDYHYYAFTNYCKKYLSTQHVLVFDGGKTVEKLNIY